MLIEDRTPRTKEVSLTEEHAATSTTAAPATDVAHEQIHPEGKAETPRIAAGLGIGLLIAGVGATRILQLIQKILVGIVVRFHGNGRTGFVSGTNVVAQALICQGAIIMPLGSTFVGSDTIQGVESLLIESIANIVGCGT